MQEEKSIHPRILILEADNKISEELKLYFEEYNYDVSAIELGEEVLSLILKEEYDLLILGTQPKGIDSFELCKKIRENSIIPIIFISKFAESADKVLGLEAGADDYMAKPFEKRELLARIRALLRRVSYKEKQSTAVVAAYRFGDLVLDCRSRHLIHEKNIEEKEMIELSGAEYRLLNYFILNVQKILSREELIEVIQGRASVSERSPFDRSIDVQVSRLRMRLKDNERKVKLIKTVRGDGYIFTGSVQHLESYEINIQQESL